MSQIQIRVRSKTGVENIKVDKELKINEFQKIIEEKTAVKCDSQKILYGFPPKPLDLSTSNIDNVSKYLANGDTITIENTSTISSNPGVDSATNQSNITSSNSCDQNIKPYVFQEDENSDGFAIRRITDDDNSCLFSAVAYVLEDKNRLKGYSLRALIAQVVKSDPFEYNEGVLGKSNEGYCHWIQNAKNWGGAIELSILSAHYKVEIGAFDISTQLMYCYGEDRNYEERVYVIYDGIHYDALAICLTRNGPEDYDITRFSVNDKETYNKLKSLVDKEFKAGKFTDTAKFSLICGDCKKVLKGEKEAAIHASLTGHVNLTEFKKR